MIVHLYRLLRTFKALVLKEWQDILKKSSLVEIILAKKRGLGRNEFVLVFVL